MYLPTGAAGSVVGRSSGKAAPEVVVVITYYY